MTIAICAVICGADSWVAIELYGCTKYEWLKTFLELPNGIPSPDGDATRTHDTCARVFALINPQEFQSCFVNWVKSREHAPAPVEFLKNVPTVIVAMPKVAAITLQRELSHAKHLEPRTSWNQQSQQLQGDTSYVTLG